MPVISTGGYVCVSALGAISAGGHLLLPKRTSGNGGAVESIVSPIFVLYAHHWMNDTADRSKEQCRRRSKVAVVVWQLRGRYLPAAKEVQGTIGLDNRDSEAFRAAAPSRVASREINVSCCGVHCRGSPDVGPVAAGRHGVERVLDRAGRRIHPDHPAANERAVA